jgi:hypothetical protein
MANLAGLFGAVEANTRRTSKRAEELRKQGIRQQIAERDEAGDYGSLNKIFIKEPWAREEFSATYEHKNKVMDDNARKASSEILFGDKAKESIIPVLQDRLRKGIQQGADMSDTVSLLDEALKGNVAPTIQQAERKLFTSDLDSWKAYKKAEGGVDRPFNATQKVVELARQESIDKTGKDLTAGQQKQVMFNWKRAQKEEVKANTFAKRNAEAATALKIAENTGLGKALAEIATASDLSAARGEITDVEKRRRAQSGVTNKLANIANHYSMVASFGAINDIERSPVENIIASARSSNIGQAFGKAIGSTPQSYRVKINNLKPLLLNDIRQASDMGARGLDSEKELQFYMQAATNEKKDIQSNMSAIYVLDQAYGEGNIAKVLEEGGKVDKRYIEYLKAEGSKILHGGSRQDPLGIR